MTKSELKNDNRICLSIISIGEFHVSQVVQGLLKVFKKQEAKVLLFSYSTKVRVDFLFVIYSFLYRIYIIDPYGKIRFRKFSKSSEKLKKIEKVQVSFWMKSCRV